MISIMNICRRLFKHRRNPRYAVKNGTYVIISPGTGAGQEQRVQLIDISYGGMAFIYKGSPSELEKSGILKLLKKTPYAEKIDFDTVSDVPVPGSTQTSEPFRKRGVKFKWMGCFEQSELGDLIDEVGICKK